MFQAFEDKLAAKQKRKESMYIEACMTKLLKKSG
jgi:hypothetical protein